MSRIITLIVSEGMYWYCRILKRNTQIFIIMVTLASIFGIIRGDSDNKYITIWTSVLSFIISFRILYFMVHRLRNSDSIYINTWKEDIICCIASYIIGMTITKESLLIIAVLSLVCYLKIVYDSKKVKTIGEVILGSDDIKAYINLVNELKDMGHTSIDTEEDMVWKQEELAIKVFEANIERAKKMLGVTEKKCSGAYKIYTEIAVLGLEALRPKVYGYQLLVLKSMFKKNTMFTVKDSEDLIGSKELNMTIKGPFSVYGETDVMDEVVIGKANDKKIIHMQAMSRESLRMNIIYSKCVDEANKNKALALALTMYCCLYSNDKELRVKAIEIMEICIIELAYNINLTTGKLVLSENALKNQSKTGIALMSSDISNYK